MKRNKKYYEDVFNLIGKDEFSVAELLEAVTCVDENSGPDFIRTPGALNSWVYAKVKCMKELPNTLVEVSKSGTTFKIKLHDAKAVAEELGVRWGSRKEDSSEPAGKAEEPMAKKELTQKDEFFITFKACRSAVRIGNGKCDRVSIKKKDLITACRYVNKVTKVVTDYTLSQIMTAISKTTSSFGLWLDATVLVGVVEFCGQDKSLEKICEIGREVYPSEPCFSFEEAAGSAYNNIKDRKIQAAASQKKQQQPEKPLTTVLTDDERFRIFLCGGYIMEHDRSKLEDLQEYLTTKGVGISIIKLESTIKLAKEFIVEGNFIYLDSRSKDFWDQFRKKYRPIDTNDYEQVIFEMAVSLDYVKERLNGCNVMLASPDRPIYRVNIPKKSSVANKNFRKFLEKFREGDYMYTDTAFVRQLKKKAEKDEAQSVLEDDVCRYEIGYFFNKKKGD